MTRKRRNSWKTWLSRKVARPSRRLYERYRCFESLEDRRLLTTDVTLAGNTLTITDADGGNSADQLEISFAASTYTITDTGGLLIDASSIGGSTGSGTSTVTVPQGTIDSITFNTLGGDDIITVDSVQASLPDGFTINDGTGSDRAFISADIDTSAGTGGVSVTVSREIVLNAGASITTSSGDVTLNANVAGTQTGNFDGVELNNATITTSGSGNISLSGHGGDTGSDNRGIFLESGAMISSTATGASAGTITLTGFGGDAADDGNGIDLTVGTVISTVDGNIALNGTAGDGTGDSNIGIRLFDAQIESTGTGANAGTITLDGTGGDGTNNNHGVSVAGSSALIQSADGNISSTGIGGAGSGSPNIGVLITASSQVRSTGSANIMLDGTGNATAGIGTSGVDINNSTITTGATGNINVVGLGANFGDDNRGIYVHSGSTISSTGTQAGAGSITFMGTGGDAAGDNNGIEIASATTSISTVNGDIDWTGTGGNGTGGSNIGIRVVGVLIESTGTGANAGSITLHGTGGDGTSNNYGIFINLATGAVRGIDGDISLTGNGGSGSSSGNIGVLLGGGQVQATGTASVDVTGTGGGAAANAHDGIFISAHGSAEVNTGTLTVAATATFGNSRGLLLNSNNGHLRSVGSGAIDITADGSGTFEDLLVAGSSTIGGPAATGDIVINTDIINLTGSSQTQSTGNLTIQPRTATTTINIGGGAGTLQLSDTEIGTLQDGFASITIGDVTSGTGEVLINTATFTDPVTIAGGTIHDLSGTDINAGTNPVTLQGNVSPGQSPGILTVTGNFSFGTGATFEAEIMGATPGTQHDQIAVTGTVDINNATLNIDDTGLTAAGNETIVLIDNDAVDAVTGTFNGLAEGAAVTVGTKPFKISYVGGDGNDVVLAGNPPETEITLVGGTLTVVDVNGGTSDDNLQVFLLGTTYQFTENNGNIIDASSIPGSTGSGTTSVTVPAAGVTGLDVRTLAGDDMLLWINAAAADYSVGGISIDGGTGSDSMLFSGALPVNMGNADLTVTSTRTASVSGAGPFSFINGNVTVEGNASGTFPGSTAGTAAALGATINITGTGDVSVTGRGGQAGGGGVLFQGRVSMTATGPTAGTVTLDGQAGGGANGSRGVTLTNPSAFITSVDGDIVITGVGTDGGDDNYGIEIDDIDRIESTGTGADAATITLNGTAGNGAFDNAGLRISSGDITSALGDITLTGIGGTADPTSFASAGVSVLRSTLQIDAGNLQIDGTSNGGIAAGVWLFEGEILSIGSGTVDITATSNDMGPDMKSQNINNVIGGASSNSPFTINADSIEWANLTVQSTGDLTIQPRTPGTTIGLGGGTGDLNLDDTELGFLVDGFSSITIGDTAAGTGTVDIDTVTFTDPITIAGGTINDGAGTDIAAGTNAVTLDGNVSPGQSPGILTVTGNFAFGTGATYEAEIMGTTAGTQHDQIDVTGTVDINNAALNIDSAGFTAVGNETFVLINNDGADAVTGTFSGRAEGSTLFVGGRTFAISYVGGDGNDVELTPAPIETEITVVGGTLTVVDVNGGTSNDNLQVFLLGTTYQFTENNGNIIDASSIPGATGSGTTSVTVPAAGVTGLDIRTLAGDDMLLWINAAAADYSVGGVMIDGGTGSDSMLFSGALPVNMGNADLTVTSTRTASVSGAGPFSFINGNVTVEGNASGTFPGSTAGTAAALGATINITGTGDVSVTGRGGQAGGGGVLFQGRVSMTATGPTAGTVTLDGQAGGGANGSRGVTLTNPSAFITSVDGDIVITGVGTDGGDDNYGIEIDDIDRIESTGTGADAATITLNGTAGNGVFDNAGLRISRGDIISALGDISLTGVGGTADPTSFASAGVSVLQSTIQVDDGNLQIDGTSNGGISAGVRLFQGEILSIGNGTVDITATANDLGPDMKAENINNVIGGASSNSPFTINADSIEWANLAVQSTGDLVIQPRTAGTTIGLGGGTGDLNLDDTELGFLVDGFSSITIGDTAAGTGTVDIDTVTFTDPITIAGGTINDAAGTDIDAGANAVTLIGQVSPGQSPGILTVTGNFAFGTGATYEAEIMGTTPGTQHDQIDVTGTVDINNATLNIDSTGFTAVGNETFVLINNDGADAVTGTFNGLAEGATVTVGGQNFSISYVGGDGNDVELMGVPETEVTLVGGVLTITDVNGANSNDDLTLSYSGGTYTLTDNGTLTITTAIAGSTGDLTVSVTFPDTGVTSIVFDTLGGNDRITVDGVQASLPAGFTVNNGTGADEFILDGAIDTGAGNVSITVSQNILLNSGSSITTSNGDITLNANMAGTATGNITGIDINNGTITSTGSGSILLDGKGGTAGNIGVRIVNGADIVSGGTGTLTLNGTGGSAVSQNYGVRIIDTGTTVTSASGTITINGQSGGTGGDNPGVRIESSALVQATGNAAIDIDGIGGGAESSGVMVFRDGIVESAAGPITIDGTSVGTQPGVFVVESFGPGIVRSTSGSVTLTGETTGTGDGVHVTGIGTIVSSTGGNVLLQSTRSIAVNNTASVTNTTGDIDLHTDDLTLAGGATIQGSGDLKIRPQTATASIGIGGGAGTLNVDDSELALLTDGFNSITIGDTAAGTGEVQIDTATFTDPINIAGGTIHDAAGTDIDAGTNAVTLFGQVSPGQSPGILTVTGNFSFGTGATYEAEIMGATPGTQHDQIDVTGTVDINNATLNIDDTGFTATGGETFVLINNDAADAVTGTFSGLPEGSLLAVGGQMFLLSYAAGDGNDVVLSPAFETEITLAAGVLTITDVRGGTSNDDLTISYAGGTYTVTDNGGLRIKTDVPGSTGDITPTVTFPDAGITSIVFDTLGGDDLIAVNSLQASLPDGFTVNNGTGDDLFALGAAIDTSAGAGDVSIDVSRSIVLSPGSSITTTSGNITLNANQQATPTTNNDAGIDINNAMVTSTGSGNILLNGKGGTAIGDKVTGSGVIVRGGGDVISSGTGTVTLNGTGGATGAQNYGVRITDAGSTVTSAAGTITINGQAGGTTNDNPGIRLENNALVQATGNAAIDIDGVGSGTLGVGVAVFLGGKVEAAAGATTIDGTSAGATTGGVVVFRNGTVESTTGSITLNGTGDNTAPGVSVSTLFGGSGTVQSTTGDISITGAATGTGNGVEVTGAGSNVDSSGGNILIQSPRNIVVGDTASVTNTSGNVTLNANQQVTPTAGNFAGIDINSGLVTSTAAGNILLNGKGGTATGDKVTGSGIVVRGVGNVTSGGTGTVTLNGTGGPTGSQNYGVRIADPGTTVTSAAGVLTINGQGGGTTNDNPGVRLELFAVVQATGNAAIDIDGTGGGTHGDGVAVFFGGIVQADSGPTTIDGASVGPVRGGVSVFRFGMVESTAGPMTINGTGSNTAAGVFVETSFGGPGQIRSTTGDVTVIGAAGATGNGVHITGAGSSVSSMGGNVLLQSPRNVVVDTLGGITNTGGNITLTTDEVEITGATPIQGAGDLTIQPLTPAATMGLGGGVGTLNLDDTELSLLMDGFNSISIGDTAAGTGTVQIDTATFTDPITIAGGTIHDAAGTDIDAGTNAVTLVGSVAPGQSPGVLNVTGNFAFGAGATFEAEIMGTTPGTDQDQIAVVGTVDINNATLNIDDAGFAAVGDEEFVLIDNDGADAVVGTFNGLPEGTNLTVGGEVFELSYASGDGNDVVLGRACSFNVTRTNDIGFETLRRAIECANDDAATDTVTFNIPGAGPHTIQPASPLPTVVNPIIIDGTSEPDFAGTPVVELDGTNAGATSHGLRIDAGNSTVQGLAINRFSRHGLLLAFGGGNTIQQNMIGTDPSGSVDLGNAFHGLVLFESPNNVVGGTGAGDGNVISGNDLHGVHIARAASTGNTLEGNKIGVAADGVAALGNDRIGVRIDQGASNNTIGGAAAGAGNVIAHQTTQGVVVANASTGNIISRNSIFSNGTLGIDLNADGVTPNDVPVGNEDGDTGPNQLQNTPTLLTATLNGTDLEINYGVPSATANSAYPLTVEFFIADAAGQEGQTFVDSQAYVLLPPPTIPAITIDVTGFGVSGTTEIVATATDGNGNTSEFSAPITVSVPLTAASAPVGSADAAGNVSDLALLQDALEPIVDAAIIRWRQAGIDAARLETLRDVDISFADLPGAYLGLATGSTIQLDADAAGHGWFIDPTPNEDSEFITPESDSADGAQRMDLLTAVMHEMGHVLGLADEFDDALAEDIMFAWLAPGSRRPH